MSSFIRIAALLGAVALARPARAADVAANVGMIQVWGLPDVVDFGAYPYVGASFPITTDEVVLIPGLGLEYSPEFDRWGFVSTFVVDRSLRPWLGLDGQLTLIHDQSGGDWGEALFFLGIGAGASFFVADGKVAISPSLNLFRGLNLPAGSDPWSLVPGLNLAHTF